VLATSLSAETGVHTEDKDPIPPMSDALQVFAVGSPDMGERVVSVLDR